MRSPAPFYELIGRPAVFWLGLILAICLGILIAGLGDDPGELPAAYINAALLSAAGFPMLAGWLFAMVIQELQHTSCAWALPQIRGRLLAGYLISGVVIAVFVAFFAALAESAESGWLLYIAVGVGGYCLGGVLVDPLLPWTAPLATLVVVGGIAYSQRLADLAVAYPPAAIAVALAPAPFALQRLFARSTLRRKPFALTSPFPGAYMMQHTAEYQRALRTRRHSGAIRWKARYLGTRAWRWAAAGAYEAYGQLTLKDALKLLNSAFFLVLLFSLSAWMAMGDDSYTVALARIVHQGVLQSPHNPPPEVDRGVGGPGIMVVFLVATFGAMMALRARSPLANHLPYPLSRRRRATVVHRSELIDSALLFCGMTLVLSAIGIVAGWVAGFETRFDYLPFFAIPLCGTLILMPVAQWGGFLLGRAVDRRDGNTLLPMILGYAGLITATVIWTAKSARLFASPVVGVGVSLLLFAAVQAAFRYLLGRFFATQDLV
ncbi:MAG: hypothetical protein PVJ49_21305 [Acidobacteriota bacterium]|jgi:hypothetical protein